MYVSPHPEVQGLAAQLTPLLPAAEAEILVLCLADAAKYVLFSPGSAAWASREIKDKGKQEEEKVM